MTAADPLSAAMFYALVALAILVLCCTTFGVAVAIHWALQRVRRADENAGRHR